MRASVVLLAVLVCGCMTSSVKYVCPDGGFVEDPEKCANYPNVEHDVCKKFINGAGEMDVSLSRECELMLNPTLDYCMGLDYRTVESRETMENRFDRSECIIALARITNDSTVCKHMAGNGEIACKASAKKDLGLCEAIVADEARQMCMQAATRRDDDTESCEGIFGQDLVWCLIHNAKDDGECLGIDEGSYWDEAVFCHANARDDPVMCGRIGDNVIRNMCLKETIEMG